MGLMGFRECNQVRWVGVRPGHRGTQVTKYGVAMGNTVELIDGTQAGITYIVHINGTSQATAAGQITLYVTTNGDALVYNIFDVWLVINQNIGQMLFEPFLPLELPAGYKVKITSTVASCKMRAFLFGWEE